MKILVAIANYGMKNIHYAERLIQEYRSMPFDVDIFVLSEVTKDFGSDISVLVGLPSKDPWSLPFGHKKLFAENVNNYDLFIYTEDDTLIRKENILAFLKATEKLEDNILPGFIRYELYSTGKKNYTDFHGPFHWIPGSVGKSGEYTVAKFSNDHSACYMLNRAQLQKALASGKFLVPPHSGRYDLICTAGTDPYTQCGFTRVICLSHLQDFELHHLSNAYLNRVGVDEDEFKSQIAALLEVFHRKRPTDELFITEKPLATAAWDKNYYEPCRHEIIRLIPSDAREILSVACGWGATEAYLMDNGKRVPAIPLDAIIGKLAEERGITLLPPAFEQALDMLINTRFDAIVLSDVLQHLPNPVEILGKLGALLNEQGVIVGSIPNLCLSRRLGGRLHAKSNKWAQISGGFNDMNLNLTSSPTLKSWLRGSGFRPFEIRYETDSSLSLLPKFTHYLPKSVTASNIVFAANRIAA